MKKSYEIYFDAKHKTGNCFLEVRHDDRFVVRSWECCRKRQSGDRAKAHVMLLLLMELGVLGKWTNFSV